MIDYALSDDTVEEDNTKDLSQDTARNFINAVLVSSKPSNQIGVEEKEGVHEGYSPSFDSDLNADEAEF